MRKIAVVGLAPSTRNQVPFEDSAWEKWGLAQDIESYPYLNRAFEIHALSFVKSLHRPYRSEEYMREFDIPLYMQEAYPEIPNAVAYPIEDVISIVGDYFNSSVAYMIGLAILEEVDCIGIWGVDMAGDDEFGYQRPNAEYMIGVARGRGIDVVIPKESSLLTFGVEGGGKHTKNWTGRYGYYGQKT